MGKDKVPMEEEEKEEASGGKGSHWLFCAAILFNGTVGGGLLNVPASVVAAGGFAYGFTLIIAFGFFGFLANMLLIWCSDLKKTTSYQATVRVHLGLKGELVSAFFVFVLMFCSTCYIFIGISDMVQRVMVDCVGSAFYCQHWFVQRTFLSAVDMVVVILPCCLVLHIDKLKYVSSVAVVAIFSVIGVTLYEFFDTDTRSPVPSEPLAWVDVFLGIPGIAIAYSNLYATVNVYSRQEPRRQWTYARAVALAIGVSTVCYCGTAWFADQLFGVLVADDFTVSLWDSRQEPRRQWTYARAVALAIGVSTVCYCGTAWFADQLFGVLVADDFTVSLWDSRQEPRRQWTYVRAVALAIGVSTVCYCGTAWFADQLFGVLVADDFTVSLWDSRQEPRRQWTYARAVALAIGVSTVCYCGTAWFSDQLFGVLVADDFTVSLWDSRQEPRRQWTYARAVALAIGVSTVCYCGTAWFADQLFGVLVADDFTVSLWDSRQEPRRQWTYARAVALAIGVSTVCYCGTAWFADQLFGVLVADDFTVSLWDSRQEPRRQWTYARAVALAIGVSTVCYCGTAWFADQLFGVLVADDFTVSLWDSRQEPRRQWTYARAVALAIGVSTVCYCGTAWFADQLFGVLVADDFTVSLWDSRQEPRRQWTYARAVALAIGVSTVCYCGTAWFADQLFGVLVADDFTVSLWDSRQEPRRQWTYARAVALAIGVSTVCYCGTAWFADQLFGVLVADDFTVSLWDSRQEPRRQWTYARAVALAIGVSTVCYCGTAWFADQLFGVLVADDFTVSLWDSRQEPRRQWTYARAVALAIGVSTVCYCGTAWFADQLFGVLVADDFTVSLWDSRQEPRRQWTYARAVALAIGVSTVCYCGTAWFADQLFGVLVADDFTVSLWDSRQEPRRQWTYARAVALAIGVSTVCYCGTAWFADQLFGVLVADDFTVISFANVFLYLSSVNIILLTSDCFALGTLDSPSWGGLISKVIPKKYVSLPVCKIIVA